MSWAEVQNDSEHNVGGEGESNLLAAAKLKYSTPAPHVAACTMETPVNWPVALVTIMVMAPCAAIAHGKSIQ